MVERKKCIISIKKEEFIGLIVDRIKKYWYYVLPTFICFFVLLRMCKEEKNVSTLDSTNFDVANSNVNCSLCWHQIFELATKPILSFTRTYSCKKKNISKRTYFECCVTLSIFVLCSYHTSQVTQYTQHIAVSQKAI